MSSYFLVRLRQINDEAEEWLSRAAFEHGALGMSEPLSFEQPEGEEDVFTRIPDERTIDVYFAEAPSQDFLAALQALFPRTQVQVSAQQERDWLAEWKKGFQPFSLAGGHWVVPSWCEAPPQARHQILIDPGMAFGTGTHETTQLAAQALIEIIPRSGAVSLLDVGTGTGILAILARQNGVTRIHATEIEPEARRVARENFARNGCADVGMDEKQVGDVKESFDIVVANIIDGVLVRLREDLLARVRPGGWLVLSGIITERDADFRAGFTLPPGRDWEFRRQLGDWLLYAARL